MKMRGSTTVLTPTVSLLALAIAAACSDSGGGERPELRQQREAAHRQACASSILALRANDNVETLNETIRASDPSDPVSQFTLQAAVVAGDFARAYQQHADLRVRAYAYLDSAVNRAASTADSIRYIERSGAFSITLPADGTIEANVLNSYQNDIAMLLSDPNHPCNWDFPF